MTSKVSDYFRLFVKREGRVLLGRRLTNLWIMVVVLFVAFLALAFSHASLVYLNYKMNDPFIKWQNIENPNRGDTFETLVNKLSEPEIQKQYHFTAVNEDYKYHLSFFGNSAGHDFTRYCRFFTDMDTELMRTILSESNIVNKPSCDLSMLGDASLGIIVTERMLRTLGYEDAPAYLYLYKSITTSGEWRSLDYVVEDADGLETFYAKLPVPVLGVVRRLPGNVPFCASVVLYGSDQGALNLGSYRNMEVSNSLLFFVSDSEDKDSFMSKLETICEEEGMESPELFSPSIPRLMPFVPGTLVEVENASEKSWEVVKRIADAVSSAYTSDHVVRVFDYGVDEDDLSLPAFSNYITVEFTDLSRLGAFVEFVSDQTDGEVELDITQTNVKENLRAVQILSNILSLALVLFAITCIILFIVNLLQSYFQRVKRNLGTFKAFGISNSELTRVYLVIIIVSVGAAIVIALLGVSVLQWILPQREPGFAYLSVWSFKTILSIAIVLVAATVTVYLVMGRLLKATPGDLIYDRQ